MILSKDMDIRFASVNDKEKILELLNDTFSDQQRTSRSRGNEYWNWKFNDNPFGKSILTIAEADNRIVAVNNLWPWEFSIRGSVIKALQPCDSAVHPDHRGKGLFKTMRSRGLEIAKAQDIKLLFNYPNENSLSAYLSLGWHYMGRIAWWVKILKPVCALKAAFSDDKNEPVKPDDKYSIDPDLIDNIAQKSKSFDKFLKINRVPGFHDWRYLKHPHRSYGMVNYVQGKRSTVAIFTINQKGNHKEIIVVDIVGSTENTLPVLKMVSDAGREMNAGFVAIMNNPRFKTNELWKIGFFMRKSKNMVVLPLDLSLEGIVQDYSNWSLMAGLHDSI